MGVIAAFQRVPPATLDGLLRDPDLLEECLFPRDEDSYTLNGYGDLQVDVSKSQMAAWSEIDRRVHGLGGELRLVNGALVLVKAIAIERDVTRWLHPETGAREQRAHSGVASLRLTPPMRQRLHRTKLRLGDATLSAVLGALLLAFLSLRLQKTYELPLWSAAAMMLAIAGLALWRAIVVFRRERVVVTYEHRRPKPKEQARPEPIDIDKAWEPIEAVLARLDGEEAHALREAISGGHEIEKSGIGHGPASYATAEEVARIASSLSRLSAEAIGDKCEPGLREYVVSHFRCLQGYYRDAAADGHAMIRYYC